MDGSRLTGLSRFQIVLICRAGGPIGGAIVAVAGSLQLASAGLQVGHHVFFAGAGFCIGGVGAHILSQWLCRDAKRRPICIRCSYPLASSEGLACCPECGLTYQREELDDLWAAAQGATRLGDEWSCSHVVGEMLLAARLRAMINIDVKSGSRSRKSTPSACGRGGVRSVRGCGFAATPGY